MKKILSTLLAFVCGASLLLACAQNPDGSANLLWSLGCLAVAILAGYGFAKLNPQILQPSEK